MGGREDATNLITTTQVAVLASIGMDHMKFLGNSLEEIAAHKTGICKPGCQVVSMRQKEAAQKVVEQTAAALGCMLTIADVANAKHVKYGLKSRPSIMEIIKSWRSPLRGNSRWQMLCWR